MLPANASAILALPLPPAPEPQEPREAEASDGRFAGMMALYAQPQAAQSGHEPGAKPAPVDAPRDPAGPETQKAPPVPAAASQDGRPSLPEEATPGNLGPDATPAAGSAPPMGAAKPGPDFQGEPGLKATAAGLDAPSAPSLLTEGQPQALSAAPTPATGSAEASGSATPTAAPGPRIPTDSPLPPNPGLREISPESLSPAPSFPSPPQPERPVDGASAPTRPAASFPKGREPMADSEEQPSQAAVLAESHPATAPTVRSGSATRDLSTLLPTGSSLSLVFPAAHRPAPELAGSQGAKAETKGPSAHLSEEPEEKPLGAAHPPPVAPRPDPAEALAQGGPKLPLVHEAPGLLPRAPLAAPATSVQVTAPAPAPTPSSALRPGPATLPAIQVAGGLRWMLKTGAQEANLQLHPESLGQVSIHLRVEGGEVHAQLWVMEPATVQAVQDGRAHLEQALNDQGLQLGSFDLHQGHRPFQEPGSPIPLAPAWPGPLATTRQEAPVAAALTSAEPHRIELYA